MNTKKLLSIAIMLILPFGAMAEYTYVSQNTPAKVANNGTVLIPVTSGPYVTATIEADDDEHIASTAYVKGAYNDTIAAINNKQGQLFVDGDEFVYVNDEVLDANWLVGSLAGEEDLELTDRNLLSAAAIKAGIQSQRVEVYTNWDDDTEKTDVAFKTVVPED